MATKKMKVVKGIKGYIPVKDNSHGGTDLGRITNGVEVEMYTDRPEENGWVQIKQEFASPTTKENWVMREHLEELVLEPEPQPEPAPEGEWEAYEYKFENEKLWLKKAPSKKNGDIAPSQAPI